MNQQIKDIILSLGLYAISIAFFFERKLSYPSNVFPYAVLIILFISATMILIRALLIVVNTEKRPTQKSIQNVAYHRVILVMISTIVYIFILRALGFYTSSFVYLILLSFLLQSREVVWKKRLMHSCLLSPIVMAFIFLLFHVLLEVPAPAGILF